MLSGIITRIRVVWLLCDRLSSSSSSSSPDAPLKINSNARKDWNLTTPSLHQSRTNNDRENVQTPKEKQNSLPKNRSQCYRCSYYCLTPLRFFLVFVFFVLFFVFSWQRPDICWHARSRCLARIQSGVGVRTQRKHTH